MLPTPVGNQPPFDGSQTNDLVEYLNLNFRRFLGHCRQVFTGLSAGRGDHHGVIVVWWVLRTI
jgi:hypothetical protein